MTQKQLIRFVVISFEYKPIVIKYDIISLLFCRELMIRYKGTVEYEAQSNSFLFTVKVRSKLYLMLSNLVSFIALLLGV